jgi:hypothetical protein
MKRVVTQNVYILKPRAMRLTSGQLILCLSSLLIATISSVALADSHPTVESLMLGSPFSQEDVELVLAGKIAVTGVQHPSDRELAVGLACLAAEGSDPMAPFDRVRPMLPSKTIEQFEMIDAADPHRAFKKLTISAGGREELRRYLDFESGIGLNLSAHEVASFQAVRRAHTEPIASDIVDTTLQAALQERYASYRSKGLSGIAPYLRGTAEAVHPDHELGQIIDQSRTLRKLFPDFMNTWSVHTKAILPDAKESYFWARSTVDDRPMIILAHQVDWRDGNTRFIGERIFYASHFFNAGQTIAISTPTREGRFFVLVERIWIDGYSGFASTKHALGEELLKRQLMDQVDRRESCLSD